VQHEVNARSLEAVETSSTMPSPSCVSPTKPNDQSFSPAGAAMTGGSPMVGVAIAQTQAQRAIKAATGSAAQR
jgi:hypothetical protein